MHWEQCGQRPPISKFFKSCKLFSGVCSSNCLTVKVRRNVPPPINRACLTTRVPPPAKETPHGAFDTFCKETKAMTQNTSNTISVNGKESHNKVSQKDWHKKNSLAIQFALESFFQALHIPWHSRKGRLVLSWCKVHGPQVPRAG